MQAREGWSAAQGSNCVVVLSTELTDELVREGLAQDIKRLIQDRRKELNCRYTDRIRVGLATDADQLWNAVEQNDEFLRRETLSVQIIREPLDKVQPVDREVAGKKLQLYVETV